MVRYIVHFTGRVQGVGFRWTTQRVARQFTVAGYVQNLPDGCVRLVAEGEVAELDAFVAAVVDHMRDNVTDHTIDQSAANGEFGAPSPGGVEIRR